MAKRNKALELTEQIARMTTSAKFGKAFDPDDSVETLDDLIVSARQITGIEPEPQKGEGRDGNG